MLAYIHQWPIKSYANFITVLISDACATCQLCIKYYCIKYGACWNAGKFHQILKGLGYDAEKCDFVSTCANKCLLKAI